MADLLLPLRKRSFPKSVPDNLRYYPTLEHFGPVFERGSPRRGNRDSEPEFYHYKGNAEGTVFVPIPPNIRRVLVRADRCTVQEVNRAIYFVAVREQITEKFLVKVEDYTGEWDRSVVIVGSSASMPRVDCSLIVCDGDLKLTSRTGWSVIIANGNIDSGSVSRTKLYAAGKVKTSKDHTFSCEVHEDGKDMPVKFLDLGRDLGLRVTDKLVLEDDWRGLRKGDTITKVGGAAVDSVPSLRRQLRSGVVRVAAAVEVRRGNESVTQTVQLDLASAKP
jgi:hypothetical protein